MAHEVNIVKLPVEFALRTKNAGDHQDYRILHGSAGRLNPNNFEQIYKQLGVGTLRLEAPDSPSRAPWLTIGTYTHTQKYIALIRQEWTERCDSGGRAVAALDCFCVSYDEAAQVGLSWIDFLRQLPDSKSLEHAQDLLEVETQARKQYVNAAVERIAKNNFESLAATAALLLQKPIGIVKVGDVEPSARLEFLDAALWLLPYGSRAYISVSTWMYSFSLHQIRFGFTDTARPDQQRLEWSANPALVLDRASPAYIYWEELCAVQARFGTEQIISQLAELTQVPDLALSSALDALSLAKRRKSLARTSSSEAVDKKRSFSEKTGRFAETAAFTAVDMHVLFLEPTAPNLELASTAWRDEFWNVFWEGVHTNLENLAALNRLCDFAIKKNRTRAEFLQETLIFVFRIPCGNEPETTPHQVVVSFLYEHLKSFSAEELDKLCALLFQNEVLLFEIGRQEWRGGFEQTLLFERSDVLADAKLFLHLARALRLGLGSSYSATAVDTLLRQFAQQILSKARARGRESKFRARVKQLLAAEARHLEILTAQFE